MLLAPKTALTIYLFAAAMGILWLSTVPLTSGIVAQIFGVRYIATLFGIVFFSHPAGSFLGVWPGGRLYDTTGTHNAVWWAGVVRGCWQRLSICRSTNAPWPGWRRRVTENNSLFSWGRFHTRF